MNAQTTRAEEFRVSGRQLVANIFCFVWAWI